ncbi:MAG: O-antigen ligase family protein [Finegoldia sp.]|nr:O-antigen ligase family protein [Finegoldia sp.]
MGSFKINLDDYSLDQRVILLTLVAMYLPFYLSFLAMGLTMVYIFKNGKYKEILQSMATSKIIIIFSVYSFVVSLLAKNLGGLFKSFGIFALLSFMLFVKQNINKNLLKDLMNVIMIFSSACFILTIGEYLIKFIRAENLSVFINFVTENRQSLGLMFLNVNYFSMIAAISVLVSAYRYLIAKGSEKLISFFIGLLSLICLLMTESAASLAAAFIAIFVLTILLKKYRYTGLMAGVLILGGGLVFVAKKIFGINLLSSLSTDVGLRFSIWVSSIEGFKQNFIFGRGPGGLSNIYYLIRDRRIAHSHNIYLNFLLSFGLVGLILIGPFVYELFTEIRKQTDKKFFKLVLCLIILVLLAGIFDASITWVQTGLLFLSIIGGFAGLTDKNYKGQSQSLVGK